MKKNLEVEKRCTELAIQLERAREEAQIRILESEVKILTLRREEGLNIGRKEEYEEIVHGDAKSSFWQMQVKEKALSQMENHIWS